MKPYHYLFFLFVFIYFIAEKNTMFACSKEFIDAVPPQLERYRMFRLIHIKTYNRQMKLEKSQQVSSVELIDPVNGLVKDKLFDHFIEGKYKVVPFNLPFIDWQDTVFSLNFFKNGLPNMKTALKIDGKENQRSFRIGDWLVTLNSDSCELISLEKKVDIHPEGIENVHIKIRPLKSLANLYVPEDVSISYDQTSWFFFKKTIMIHLQTHVVDAGQELSEMFSGKPPILYQSSTIQNP